MMAYNYSQVHKDISLNMDTEKVTALTLLVLSEAVDTSYYSVVLEGLSDWYGISGRALMWNCSFLINMFQSIQIRNNVDSFAVFPNALFLDYYCLVYIPHH